jgi:hypothetical protein
MLSSEAEIWVTAFIFHVDVVRDMNLNRGSVNNRWWELRFHEERGLGALSYFLGLLKMETVQYSELSVNITDYTP